MKYSERKELVEGLRELADFLENDPKAIALPMPFISFGRSIYEYATDENGHKDYSKTDEFETRLMMRSIAKALAPCDKDYQGSSFTLKRKFGKHITVKYQTTRDAVCEKKVISTKVVPARMVPEYVEEEVEWSCSDSLLK